MRERERERERKRACVVIGVRVNLCVRELARLTGERVRHFPISKFVPGWLI